MTVGSLTLCIEHGIPQEILVPLLPVTSNFGGKGAGKAPAKFTPATGSWGAFDDWQRGGHSSEILRDADAAGGNAGVILGAPYNGLQMVALDIDLEDGPHAVGWCRAIVHSIQRLWNQTILVRETWPHRALLLVNLPVDADPGAKKKFTISYVDPKTPGIDSEVIGKIEILARGQQAAIAGTHISGNPMQWYFLAGDQETERYPAPPVKVHVGQPNEKVTLPTFPTFDDIVLNVVNLLDAMEPHGFTYTALTLSSHTGVPPALSELAAPSAADLATLLDQTPNPPSVDRDVYANIMMAIGGARAGLIAMRGILSMADEGLIARAVGGWASRWQAPRGHVAGTIDEEIEKWNIDWVRPRDDYLAGWRHVLMHCQALGAPPSALADIAMDHAQMQFKADFSQPIPARDVPGANIMSADQFKLRQGVNPDLVVTSDIAIAERLLSWFTGNAVWVPILGTWLVWDGIEGWKADEVSTCKVGVMISDQLWWYIGVYGAANPAKGIAGWDQATHEKMLSEGKLRRVSSVLQMHLSKAANEIDQGIMRLQTPSRMYELADMRVIDISDRLNLMRCKAMYETRATDVEPSDELGPTPYFDRLTLGLCDGNEDVLEWLLCYLGYCLLGNPADAVFLMIYGAGGNGKGTLSRVLLALFGSYAVALDAEVIQDSGRGRHPASLNRLRGKRLAVIDELDEDARWNNRVLKQITGGDAIEARNMHKDPSTFKAQAGIIIFANDKPPIERADPAIQRRFRLIETVVRRPESDTIVKLDELIIREEGPYVLRKLMVYAQKVYHNGLPKAPPAMKAAATATMASHDVIYGWLQAECEYGTTAVKDEEESVDELRGRCEAYMKRLQKESGDMMVADKIRPKDFSDRLRREGISFEDPVKTDKDGRPLRHRKVVKGKVGGVETVYTCRGIKLKMRAVA